MSSVSEQPKKVKKAKKSKKNKKKKQTVGMEEEQPVAAAPAAAVVSAEVAVEEQEEATWASLGLAPVLQETLSDLKWLKPSPIQAQALPHALAGKDIIGLAETGSGKTGAFGLPMLHALLQQPQGHFGLVLAPTRELAFQISEQLDAMGSRIDLRTCCIVGGVDMMAQAIQLMKKPHIIVATPGRIVDHLENTKGFHLRYLKFLVLDEADRLLTLDFEEKLDKILDVLPRKRTTYLFSATMTTRVAKLQRASLVDPVKVEVSRKYGTVKNLKQYYSFVPAKYKDTYLAFILNLLAGTSSIIFTSTCDHTRRVALMLRNLGFAAIPLHGKMSQPQRFASLSKFKTGNRNILIATDVASRGLDIPAVDCVVNYDIPTHSKDYIHRVGRTARAGRSGKAINLVTQYDVELYQRIEKLIEMQLPEYKECSKAEEVLVMLDRVSEANRMAQMELREEDQEKQARKRKKADHNQRMQGGPRMPKGAKKRKMNDMNNKYFHN